MSRISCFTSIEFVPGAVASLGAMLTEAAG